MIGLCSISVIFVFVDVFALILSSLSPLMVASISLSTNDFLICLENASTVYKSASSSPIYRVSPSDYLSTQSASASLMNFGADLSTSVQRILGRPSCPLKLYV